MEGLELTCFQIISAVGSARSFYIEAIQEAKAGHYDSAKDLIQQGQAIFLEGHHAHAALIQQEASGDQLAFQLLLPPPIVTTLIAFFITSPLYGFIHTDKFFRQNAE